MTELDKYITKINSNPDQTESLIKIINEKNNFIEKYRNIIEMQKKSQQVEIQKFKDKIMSLSKENSELKNKLEKLNSSDLMSFVNYYESEIAKILIASEKAINQYKERITILLNNSETEAVPSEFSNTFSNHMTNLYKMNSGKNRPVSEEQLKRVINTLMKENSELKKTNSNLLKITRKNETYKQIIKSYDKKFLETEKTSEELQNKQIRNLDNITQENLRLKEDIQNKQQTINNLTKALNSISSQSINSVPNTARSKSSKNKISNSFNKTFNITTINNNTAPKIIYIEDIQLDKYLNCSKISINEKAENISAFLQEIIEKINKDNSIYKKIFLQKIKNLEDCFSDIIREITVVIRKSNTHFNKSKTAKKLLDQVVIQYQQNRNKISHKAGMQIDENLIKYIVNFLITF